MKLSDIVVSEATIANLEAKDRDAAIEELVNKLAEAGSISKAKVPEVVKAVLAREAQATTGIGKGISLPHAKLKGIKTPICALGRSAGGLDFASLDAQPVFSVILLLSNPDDPDQHLQAMETIFKHVQRELFRKFLRQSETVEAINELVQEADEIG